MDKLIVHITSYGTKIKYKDNYWGVHASENQTIEKFIRALIDMNFISENNVIFIYEDEIYKYIKIDEQKKE